MSTGLIAAPARMSLLGRVRRRRPPALVLIAGAVVLLVCVAALLPALFPGGGPSTQRLAVGLTGSSGAHPFGTDPLGRDILARTVAGARQAVVGPLGVALGSALLGGAIGLVAGFLGGRTDMVLMRVVDAIGALPGLLVTIVIGGVLGGGFAMAVALLAVLFSPIDARIVRAATLELRGQSFVEAASLLGTSKARIMARHIVPNVLPLELSTLLLNFALALVALASLSFLGVGISPGTPDWGRMLAEGRALLGTNPTAVIAPVVAIALTAASVNVLGDWTYERFVEDEGGAR
jgi:peptide/nickel transport system permease protein